MAVNGSTPLDTDNVFWKGGEDSHGVPGTGTGHLHNYGNVEAIGGIFNTVYSNVGVSTLNPSATLGSGNIWIGFDMMYYPYPAALATAYHPVNYYLTLPFPVYIPVRPTTLALYFEGIQQSVNTAAATVTTGLATTIYGRLCCLVTLPTSNRTVNQTVIARGYVLVMA